MLSDLTVLVALADSSTGRNRVSSAWPATPSSILFCDMIDAMAFEVSVMRRIAELGMGNQTMEALSGHSRDDEVARYMAAANQRAMADDAIAALARWELDNLGKRLSNNAAENG